MGCDSFICIDFDGFERTVVRVEEIETVEGGAVAMECDYKEAMPVPEVVWYTSIGGGAPTIVVQVSHRVAFLEGGRYLVIAALTAAHRNSNFFCEVRNAYLGSSPQMSPTTYTLSGDIPNNEYIVYKPVTQVTTTVGSTVMIAHAIARRSGPMAVLLVIVCPASTAYTYSGSGVLGQFTGFLDTGVLNIPCAVGSSELVIFSIVVAREYCMYIATDMYSGCKSV